MQQNKVKQIKATEGSIFKLSQSKNGGSDGKESTFHAGDLGSIPGLGRSPGEGHGDPLQCSCLENSRDRGAWQFIAHGVTKTDRLTLSLSCLYTLK